ncbi:MAG: hypothetical protein L0211_05745 [Planctomycetaceae bacterium]|nr:hypothetical protein [Planctomycetaceae bacterium]
MPTNLQWKAPFTTSCLHAADGASRGMAVVDPVLAEAIGGPAADLQVAIEWLGVPPGRLWRQLLGLSGSSEVSRHIAETALAKTVGRGQHFEAQVSRLAASLLQLQNSVRAAIPKLVEELVLRERPLREQWEARGPGLLVTITNLTEPDLLAEQAEVLLVRPAFGGAGAAHLQSNAVRIEAVLANPHADLPEVVRLAWLLAQLDLDLPRHSEEIQADRLPHVARLAMIPVVLKAAEAVELARYSPELVGRAMAAWHVAVPPGLDAVGIVGDWWETYQLDRPPFQVALAALDAMIG